MRVSVLCLAVVAVVAFASLSVSGAALSKPAQWNPSPLAESLYQSEFTNFVKRHDKKYTHDEFALRYSIFKANYNKIRHRTFISQLENPTKIKCRTFHVC